MVRLILYILTIIPSDFDGIICSERVFQKVLGRIPMQIVTVWFYQEFTIRPDQAPAMKQEFRLLFSAKSRWFWVVLAENDVFCSSLMRLPTSPTCQ